MSFQLRHNEEISQEKRKGTYREVRGMLIPVFKMIMRYVEEDSMQSYIQKTIDEDEEDDISTNKKHMSAKDATNDVIVKKQEYLGTVTLDNGLEKCLDCLFEWDGNAQHICEFA